MTRLGIFLAIALFVLSGFCVVPAAYAQTAGIVAETVVITPVWINQTLGFSGFTASPSYGSISAASSLDGYTFDAFSTQMYGRGTAFVEGFELSGVASDPGAGWLQSMTCNGVTFLAANLWQGRYVYNATNHTVGYTWHTSSTPLSGRTFMPGTTVTCTIVHAGNSGWVRPKYQVVGLTYAPPGSRSTATYTNGFLSGTGTSNTASYSSSLTNKISIATGGSFFDVVNGKTTSTVSAGWTQEQDSSSSLSIVEQNSTGLIVPGPSSSGLGVDHDYDTIYIWLNPEVFVELGKTSVFQGGYGWDGRDTITGMDVIPLTLGQLRGTQPISDPAVQARLARTWDTSLGALTSSDYLEIAGADPFYHNPSFNPNTDTSHRFEFPESGSPATPTDLIFNYIPEPPGGQPTGQTYTSNYSSTTISGQTAKDSHTTTFSVDSTGNVNFFATLSVDLLTTASYTTANQWSNTITSGTTQTMNFTIYAPLSTDNYTGPTAMQVWKDNVYGTFMFYPEN
jgi:hypothetical protein